MQVVNWLELQPPPADLEALRDRLEEALPLRKVCQLLVETTLRAYPWTGRADLIPCYHPSKTYEQGQRIALLIPDPRNVSRIVWLVAQVKRVRLAENPVQGRFQVVTLGIQSRQIQMAGGVANASYPEPDLSNYTSEDLTWLAKWVLDTQAAALQATLKKLIQSGQIRGQLVGQTFLPEHVAALSVELLDPVFARLSPARPWISLEEILRGLPDLSPLRRETALALLRAALRKSPYRALGGDRWTAPELLDQLNREVPRGLPRHRSRSKVPLWTKQDKQDLAGYSPKFMPAEARGAFEELGFGKRRPASAPAPAPWHPPNEPVRLGTLCCLHITQAYFPAWDVIHAFAPDVQLAFLQFIHGDHQPFLLDRENGLLKAVYPEALRSRILEEDLPAGTDLWLEYQGSEKYRITPRPLPFKRRISGKLAYLDEGHLLIAHTHMSMMYEGTPSLFKANLHSEQIETLFAEASRTNLSVREALIYAIQEICATDPDRRASWLDILNAVFLQRMCSPSSVLLLLYTQPCFESLGGGYFRYKPMPETIVHTHKKTDRLTRLWDSLLSHPVAADPVIKERRTAAPRLESGSPIFRPSARALPAPSLLSLPETGPEVPVITRSYTVVEEQATRKVARMEEEQMGAILLSNDEPEQLTTPEDASEPASTPWKESLERLYHSLVELQKAVYAPLPEVGANLGGDAPSDVPIETAHEESLSLSSPFHWEPKPAWVNPPVQPKPSLTGTTNPPRFAGRSKLPIRPLHKQPFYKRYFFYLRRWLSRNSKKRT